MQNPISTIRQNNLEKFIYQPPDHMKHSEKKIAQLRCLTLVLM